MGLFDDGLKLGTGVAIGIGAVILAPTIIPVLAGVAKPVAKAAIKGGLILFERGREALAEVVEVTEDLTAEAKAELAEQREMISIVPQSGSE